MAAVGRLATTNPIFKSLHRGSLYGQEPPIGNYQTTIHDRSFGICTRTNYDYQQ